MTPVDIIHKPCADRRRKVYLPDITIYLKVVKPHIKVEFFSTNLRKAIQDAAHKGMS